MDKVCTDLVWLDDQLYARVLRWNEEHQLYDVCEQLPVRNADQYVVVVKYNDGDPDDVFGPFASYEEADEWADRMDQETDEAFGRGESPDFEWEVQKVLPPTAAKDILTTPKGWRHV